MHADVYIKLRSIEDIDAYWQKLGSNSSSTEDIAAEQKRWENECTFPVKTLCRAVHRLAKVVLNARQKKGVVS